MPREPAGSEGRRVPGDSASAVPHLGPPADLAADTRVTKVAPGRYAIVLGNAWDYLHPSGGVVKTLALRAAIAELAEPTLRCVSATATFCSPVSAGSIELGVHVLRSGVATAQLRVDLCNPGAELGAVVTATFARDRAGPDVRGAAMPRVRSVAESLPTDDPPPPVRFRFYDQLDCRIAAGERTWTSEHAAGPARYARWFRYRVPQRTEEGLLDRLALPPILDTMPTALARAIGPGPYRFYAPSLDLTSHFVDDTSREWILLSAYVRRARAGMAIGEIEAWDDEGKLLAFATQAMYIKTLAGAAPVVDASER